MSLFGLISTAHAQATSGGAQPPAAGLLESPLVPVALMFVVLYFLVWRPQQQRTKQHKEQLSQLRRGDSIVTSGGIIGTIARVVSDDELLVDIAENVRVRVVRSTITTVNAKSEAPASGSGNGSKDESDPKATKPRKQGGTAS